MGDGRRIQRGTLYQGEGGGRNNKRIHEAQKFQQKSPRKKLLQKISVT